MFIRKETCNSRGIHELSTVKPYKNRSRNPFSPRQGSIYFYTTICSCFILDSYQMRRYFQPHPQLWCSACALGHTADMDSRRNPSTS